MHGILGIRERFERLRLRLAGQRGALVLIFGLALGREGPSVHLGAASGSQLGRWVRIPHNSLRTLVGRYTLGALAMIAAVKLVATAIGIAAGRRSRPPSRVESRRRGGSPGHPCAPAYSCAHPCRGDAAGGPRLAGAYACRGAIRGGTGRIVHERDPRRAHPRADRRIVPVCAGRIAGEPVSRRFVTRAGSRARQTCGIGVGFPGRSGCETGKSE